MKQIYTLTVCLFAMAFSGAVAQTYVNSFPWTQDFESSNTCGASCTSVCPNIGDFSQTGIRDWVLDIGGTTSSATGPSIDHTLGTSSGKYIYAETSFPCSSIGSTWIAESPYFNFTNTSGGYELSFWYHQYGSSMGNGHLDVDDGSGNWTLDFIPSWTGNTDLWQEEVVDLTSFGGNDSVRFRIRYEGNTSFGGDMALDDFQVKLLLANDAGITSILSPSNPFCGSDSQMVVELTNLGTDTLTAVTVSHTVNGTAGTNISWTGSLGTGQTDAVTINVASNIVPGTSVAAWTSMPNGVVDLAPSNDSSSASFFSGMQGTYQIPGDFASFTDAVNDLVALGVCDDVIFNVATGSYDEQIYIPSILGSGPDATITFQGATGNPNDVSLEFNPSSIFNNEGVVYLDGVTHITFQDMTIDNMSTSTSYGRVFLLGAGTESLNIDNCNVNGNPANTTSTNNVVIDGYQITMEDINITNSHISNGSYAIRLYGPTGTHNNGFNISNNVIDSFYFYGIYQYYNDSTIIEGNEISTDAPYTGSIYGMRIWDCDKQLEINNNRVYNVEGAELNTGIYVYNCDGSLNNRLSIANNCITVGNIGDNDFAYGLYVFNTGLLDVVNNTATNLNTSGTGYGHYLGNGGLVEEYNNSFVNYGTGTARYVTTTYALSASENNNYLSNGASVLYLNGNYTTVEDFGIQTGFDMHSVSTDPAFNDTIQCITCNDTMDAGGMVTGVVTEDINGEVRNTTAPDIGAVEYIAAGSFDLGDDTTLCADEFLLESGPAQSVTWNVDGTPSSNPTYLLQANNNEPQTFNVSVNILTNNCGPASDNLAITLVPDANLDSAQHICADEVATLTPGGGNNATYAWNTGDLTATIDVDAPGTYSVTKMEDGCESMATILVTQSDAVALQDIEECSDNLPVTIDATINDGISYAWSGGTSVTSAQNTFNDADVYSVTATDAFGCISSADFQLTVLEEPVAAISETHTGVVYFFDASSSIYVTPTSTVTWDFGNGQTGSGAMDTTNYVWNGTNGLVTYTVTLTIDNGCGEDIVTLDVTPDPLGVEDVAFGTFAVYPNPATDLVNIQLTDAFGEQGSVEFIDISGRVVMTETLDASSDFAQMDVSSLASGSYLVKITGESQVLVNRVSVR